MHKTPTVTPLYEGTFSVGLDKKFHRIARDDDPARGALKISLNPFLLSHPDEGRNMLIDTGIGGFGEDTSTDTIKANLEKAGLTELDITDVIASHLHYDHIGGLAGREDGYWELTFPEARVWVSRGGWDKVMGLEEYYDEEKTEFVHFLDAKADLHFLEPEDEPLPGMRVRHCGGHTEFSQVLYFEPASGGRKYLMAGDVLATRGAVNRKYAAKYDYDPDLSSTVRAELVRQAWQEEYIILGYHDSFHPLFRLTDYDEQKGYTIAPVE